MAAAHRAAFPRFSGDCRLMQPFGGEHAYLPVADTVEEVLRSAKELALRERVESLQA